MKLVYICSVFTRPELPYIGPTEYKTFRVQINKLLEEFVQGHDSVTFWPHKRIFNSPLSLFEHDGTHLNIVGSKNFLNHYDRQPYLHWNSILKWLMVLGSTMSKTTKA